MIEILACSIATKSLQVESLEAESSNSREQHSFTQGEKMQCPSNHILRLIEKPCIPFVVSIENGQWSTDGFP
jgi:hypothetical protein